MTTDNDEQRTATLEILREVYRVAEGLYLMLDYSIPEGRTFARCLDAQAERCYNTAVAAYYNHACLAEELRGQ